MGSLPRDIDTFLATNFTHLVIGGGTAGLVVATRLAESEDVVVGILEAGPAAYDEPRINVPGRFGETLGTEYDWQFSTVPQPGLNGRSIPWARGKVLGGSSALNFMTWNRACKEDYDAWAELGNDGWAWDDMLPYFMKSETLQESDEKHQLKHKSYFDRKFHGDSGPVHTTYSSQFGASHQHWQKTLENLGVEVNKSHFGGSDVGSWTSLTTVEPSRRERSYSATAYYRPNSTKPNLVLLTGATAQEVLLDSVNGQWIANGARFSHEGEEHSITVSGEVIICAGSIQSPQLLELSGIGNTKVLEAAGIPVKVDNPAVGENLQDHLMTCMIYEIHPHIQTLESLRSDPHASKLADIEYATTRTGIRTTIPNSVAYIPFSHYHDPYELDQIGASMLQEVRSKRDEILVKRFTEEQGLGQIEFNFDLSNYSPVFQSEEGKRYATMLMMLQYPFSRGSIHLPPTMMMEEGERRRATVDDKPVIDPRYYEGRGGEVDLECMAKGQRFADKIVGTEPLRGMIVGRVWPPVAEGGGKGGEEEDFREWVRDNTTTDWHPVGTCAMGGTWGGDVGGDMGGERNGDGGMEGKTVGDGYVVDERLRVHGVQGLRVVDASIMPLQISAHLQATVYAIGEKGAAMVLEDWKVRDGN
ncbi:MAG: hypothetical protein Q9220_004779 [cf. Caloplaca sp. 1 TL-2023]